MNWSEVEAIGTWVAGIGTIGTVLVALQLARNSNVGKVRLVADFLSTLQKSLNGIDTRDILLIEITNVGSRNLKINRIAWRIGKHKNRKLILFQMLDGQASSLPKTLSDGENIYFEIEKDEWVRNMINQISKHDSAFLETKLLDTIQIGASATNGQDFWQDAGSELKTALITAAQTFLSKNSKKAA